MKELSDRQKAISWFRYMELHDTNKLLNIIQRHEKINDWLEKGYPLTGHMIEQLWKSK